MKLPYQSLFTIFMTILIISILTSEKPEITGRWIDYKSNSVVFDINQNGTLIAFSIDNPNEKYAGIYESINASYYRLEFDDSKNGPSDDIIILKSFPIVGNILIIGSLSDEYGINGVRFKKENRKYIIELFENFSSPINIYTFSLLILALLLYLSPVFSFKLAFLLADIYEKKGKHEKSIDFINAEIDWLDKLKKIKFGYSINFYKKNYYILLFKNYYCLGNLNESLKYLKKAKGDLNKKTIDKIYTKSDLINTELAEKTKNDFNKINILFFGFNACIVIFASIFQAYAIEIILIFLAIHLLYIYSIKYFNTYFSSSDIAEKIEMKEVGYKFIPNDPLLLFSVILLISVIFIQPVTSFWRQTNFITEFPTSLLILIIFINYLSYEERVISLNKFNKLIGDSFHQNGLFDKACEKYEDTLEYIIKCESSFYKKYLFLPEACPILHPQYKVDVYLSLGDSKFRLGELVESLEHLNEALQISKKSNLFSYIWIIYFKQGQIKERQQNLEETYDNYKQSIEIIEQLREYIKTPQRKTAFFEDKVEVYVKMVFLCLRIQKKEEAFNYVERTKGRIFLELLGTEKIMIKASPDLIMKEKEIRQEMKEKYFEIEKILSGLNCDSENYRRARDQYENIMKKYDELLLRIKEEDPDYYSLRKVEPKTLEEIQSILNEKEIILEFFVGEEVIAFIIQKDKMNVERMKITKQYLEKKINEFRKKIDPYHNFPNNITGKSGKIEHNQNFWIGEENWDVSKELYDELIKKLEPILNGKNLIIIPHGILHYLPFNALYDGKSWFIEKYETRFLHNASMLAFLKENKKENFRDVLVVGNPTNNLNYSDEEANKVADKFKVQPLLGDKATKESIIESSKNKDLLHLSCHGKFEADFPSFSGLTLAKDDILVTDIYNLDLNADLVVLSACKTGLGSLTNGDEIEGLTRAFMSAGTPSVISSLWTVDSESTSELFITFYEKEGDKVKKLREAQIKIMEKYKHPYYWAGFVLFGER